MLRSNDVKSMDSPQNTEMSRNMHANGPRISYIRSDDYSDEESTSANEHCDENPQPEVQLWDTFRYFPPKPETGSMADKRCFEVTLQVVKVFVYGFVFVVVLGGSAVAKGTILFMTSHLNEGRYIPYCNYDIDQQRQFVTSIPKEERIAWIWCIVIAFAVPEFFTLLHSIHMCMFKKWKTPNVRHFLFLLFVETCHVVGLALLFLVVLPNFDAVRGAMISNCVCFVPGFLGLLSRNKRDDKKGLLFALGDVAALIVQTTGFIAWPLLNDSHPSSWFLPPALLMISCRWWSNYVTRHSYIGFVRSLAGLKENLRPSRHFVHGFMALWKTLVFLTCAVVIAPWKGIDTADFFVKLGTAFGEHNVTVIEVTSSLKGDTTLDLSQVILDGETIYVNAAYFTPLLVLLIHSVCALLAYELGKFACKILIQGFSFAFPVTLTVPVCVSLLVTFCVFRLNDPCAYHDIIPDYLFFTIPRFYTTPLDFLSERYSWMWLLWLLSQMWITLHIWTPKCERLAATERLFAVPTYDSFIVDQSLALNRRKDDGPKNIAEDGIEDEKDVDDCETIRKKSSDLAKTTVKSSDHITRIYACATMWHETKGEITEFISSILRMDEDQCARRVTQKYLKVSIRDYYELETHIFFDDAFCCMHGCTNACKHDENETQVNPYVMMLIETVEESIVRLHIRNFPPVKYPTPYGGRLVWTLPGKTKMIAHLKDKNKIRHRKRWSQVMYMYYLLGYRLMELPIDVARKEVIAENTYILTLDGDIDFQPAAVRVLVDLMERNRDLGAACGRIHPIGSGPMVWFQMFEYAIGHWLQKSTEHLIGCVLCSPGCFSLFRAKALMEDNVMRKYATRSTEARHYIQYDQGEDRWLCTLILQMGYRVEYSAASDAYTHAPESFNEFYNQRRRWIPSTVANIFDLLSTAKQTRKMNDNISWLYIIYQWFLMGSTILGPGTIFLMLIGAFVTAFNIDNWSSFYYNLIPILIFVIVCATSKASTQLFVAAVISTIYGLVMIAVFVGIMIQIADDGWLAPSTLLFLMVAGQLIVAGLFHPQELICLLWGVIYYVTVPSMYMLLIIYSLFNVNNVTWGTRETKESVTEEEQEQREKVEQDDKKRSSSFLTLRRNASKNDDEQGSIVFSLAGLFKCILCTHGKPTDEKRQLDTISDSLNRLGVQLDSIERNMDQRQEISRRRNPFIDCRMGNADDLVAIGEDLVEGAELHVSDADTELSEVSENVESNHERTFLVSPYWLQDERLRKGEVDFLSNTEEGFWKDLIEKYLHPIDEDKHQQKKTAQDLKNLRDENLFKFFMVNALFVFIVFLMQLNKDLLHLQWPLGTKYNVSYDEDNLEVLVTKEYLQLEPIGCLFIVAFAMILLVQFLAMLFHRFDTFSHMLVNTTLDWYCCKKTTDFSKEAMLERHVVDIVRELQRVDENETDIEENTISPKKRKTIHKLEENRQRRPTLGTFESAFRKNFNETGLPRAISSRMSSRAFKAFEEQRSTVMAERKRSQVQKMGVDNIYDDADSLPSRSGRSSQTYEKCSIDDRLGYDNGGFELEEFNPRSNLALPPRISQVTFRDATSKI